MLIPFKYAFAAAIAGHFFLANTNSNDYFILQLEEFVCFCDAPYCYVEHLEGVVFMPDGTAQKPVLAIYDFRSKQEYIYRTNRMREITGASELIANMYDAFLDMYDSSLGAQKQIVRDWTKDSGLVGDFSGNRIGEVVYIGGGNLCILYKNREEYVSCNRVFSRLVHEKAYGLSMIAACADWSDDFEEARASAYRALDIKKRIGDVGAVCNVLPYTQVSRESFQPIVSKSVGRDREDLSLESELKRVGFEEKPVRDADKSFIDDIATDRGNDSLIAIIYSDGNSIGDRLKGVNTVADMRRFSVEVHEALVENTKKAIQQKLDLLPEQYRGHRVIIDHGDEITLVCNAHAAPFALDAYFEALEGSGYEACAGMAICHSHDPFATVYEIAEECCESGKVANRKKQGNASYIDFHFCRSGILGSLDQIREVQEGELTNRPYCVDEEYSTFLLIGKTLKSSKITRSDLKELNRAIVRGRSWYKLEYERLKAKDLECFSRIEKFADGDQLRKYLFDVTSFWDVYNLRFDVAASADHARREEGGAQ